jgi:hypothetical protein
MWILDSISHMHSAFSHTYTHTILWKLDILALKVRYFSICFQVSWFPHAFLVCLSVCLCACVCVCGHQRLMQQAQSGCLTRMCQFTTEMRRLVQPITVSAWRTARAPMKARRRNVFVSTRCVSYTHTHTHTKTVKKSRSKSMSESEFYFFLCAEYESCGRGIRVECQPTHQKRQ